MIGLELVLTGEREAAEGRGDGGKRKEGDRGRRYKTDDG